MSEFPSDHHQLLKPFEGKFSAVVTLWMGPGEPMVSTGTMTNSFELNNQFLHQHYEGDATDGPFPGFQGRGYWGFNTATNEYEGFWIDTASTLMMHESGAVDDSGKVWEMAGDFKNPQDGSDMKKRSVIKLEDNDHHTMEQFMATADGEFKTMEIKYERIS